MSYPPKIHQNSTQHQLLEVIKSYPLATLISINGSEPIITQVPLVWNGSKLIGHMDVHNPQAAFLKNNHTVTAVFSGPQCYISPSIYTTTQLPTWNYIKVHVKGNVTAVSKSEDVKQSLIYMTHSLEEPEHKYVLDPDNEQMTKYLPYIHAFEIDVTSWEGTFKLSQKRSKTDAELAKQELIKKNQKCIEAFIISLF